MPTVDRISTLPDEILCHILSFLPTQNAIATSVLSKRWKPLWLAVSTLDFTDLKNDKPDSCFRNFMHRVILAREEHQQPITSFRLHFESSLIDLSNSDLNKWVNVAIKRGIEILDIEVSYTLNLSLTCCIFSCRTLVVLKLNHLYFDDFSSVELPSLKTLHLTDVIFIKRHNLMDLLNGCLCLEDLEATSVYHYNYDGGYTRKGDFKSFPLLVRANIWDLGMDIPLKAFCNLEFLRINEGNAEHYIGDIHAFPNLTKMEIMFYGYDWNFVLKLLGLTPKLQSFELEIFLDSADPVWPSPSSVPECLLSQLRECYIRHYYGTESEVLFARYILQNSRALKTIKIWSVSSEFEDEMIDELVSCPWSSPTCELFFNNWKRSSYCPRGAWSPGR